MENKSEILVAPKLEVSAPSKVGAQPEGLTKKESLFYFNEEELDFAI